jgi:LysR family transcriptional regulator, nitrogen assimilation regulatory protein
MDLRKLRYFIGIAEAGGFHRAAKTLNIAQSALSKQIRELEAEIGLKLLDRGPLGISLTAQGQRFLVESREILDRVDRLASSIAAPTGTIRGSVKIGVPASVAAHLFGPLARRLHDLHPEVHLKCITDMPRLMDLLSANELDLGLVTLADPEEITGPWHFNKLVCEQDYLIGPSGALDPSRPVRFADMLELPLVLSPMPHFRRSHMQRLAAAAGKTLKVAAEAGVIGAQASFVCQGLGFAVMPFSAAILMKSAGSLEIAPIEGLRSWRLLMRRSDRVPSPASVVVSELIVSLFSDGLPPFDRIGSAPVRVSETV